MGLNQTKECKPAPSSAVVRLLVAALAAAGSSAVALVWTGWGVGVVTRCAPFDRGALFYFSTHISASHLGWFAAGLQYALCLSSAAGF